MAVIGRQPAPAPITSADIGTGIITPDKLNFYVVTKTSDTGAANMPAGTTAQRPGSPVVGQMRVNTTTNITEVYTPTGWASVSIDLSPFTQLNTTALPHSVVNSGGTGLQGQGSSAITTYGATAPSVSYGALGSSYNFATHGGHSGSNSYPMYWAFYAPTAKAVNQLKVRIHGNSWGYFELWGSVDCGSGANFATNGTWNRLTLSNATSPQGNENMGGNGSGYADGTEFTYNYTNSTPYNGYRLVIRDSSKGNQSLGTFYGGSAGYEWQFNRI